MTHALPWNRRRLIVGLLALGLLGLLILAAPATSRRDSGSTWHRGPAGYSAWYESLEQQGITVQRWQRPLSDLIERIENDDETFTTLVQDSPTQTETLLAVLPAFIDQQDLPTFLPWVPEWLEAGHRLVVLGVKTPVTAAPFSQTLTSEAGPVQIDTRRRYPAGRSGGDRSRGSDLEDEYGAVVWRQTIDSGQFVVAATPHLGANAYRDQPGNFALLTELVTRQGGRLWVDEYLHGYRDEDAIAAEPGGGSWASYLARTPLLVIFAQALAVTLLALLALNHRLGQRRTLQPPAVDNSRAYIQALAGVLHKAGSHDFVVQTLGQAERLQLQKALGLGHPPLPVEQLQAAWNEQSGRPTADLATILNPPAIKGESQLRHWLKQLQSLHSPTQETPTGHD